METQVEDSTPIPDLGRSFVTEYYNLLRSSPETVHKFYKDTSVIARPDLNGVMSSLTIQDGINKTILSPDYKNCDIEVQNIDNQVSHGNGVLVLVTGLFTQNGSMKRKFTQLFFLVHQERTGYFVLNDVFRFVDDLELPSMKTNDDDDDDDDDAPTGPVTPDPEPTVTSDLSVLDQVSTPLEEDACVAKDSNHPLENGTVATVDKGSSHPLENETISAVVKETVDGWMLPSQNVSLPSSVGTSQNDANLVSDVSDIAASTVQEDPPKRTYASVANELNFKKQPFQKRVSPPKPVQKAHGPRPVNSDNALEKSNNQAAEKSNNHALEKSNNHPVNKGYSIFVANLPMDATEEQLHEAFKQFGPIKPKGIQVRSYERERNCFGFVEFESAQSMQSALLVSTIMIGGRKAHIEEKKANPSKRGGFRNDSFRGRGGRGSGRNEFGKRNHQKSDQNGEGKVTGPRQPQVEA